MNLIDTIKEELKSAKECGISSWIDEVTIKLDKAHQFFELAEKLGLVEDRYYKDGIPKGDDDDVNLFYQLEDYFDYPEPQKTGV